MYKLKFFTAKDDTVTLPRSMEKSSDSETGNFFSSENDRVNL